MEPRFMLNLATVIKKTICPGDDRREFRRTQKRWLKKYHRDGSKALCPRPV